MSISHGFGFENRSSRARRRTRRAERVRFNVESLEARQLLTLNIPSGGLQLDFGTSSSSVAVGAVAVLPKPFATSVGYGWLGSVSADARTTGSSDPLLSDAHKGTDQTLRLDVAPGTYDLTFTLGDNLLPRDKLSIYLQGSLVASNLATAAGSHSQSTYRVVVGQSPLDIRLLDTGGVNALWSLNGLKINTVSTAALQAPASGPQNVTATGGGGAVLLTWTAPVGSVSSYKVYRGTSSGAETLYATGVTATSFADTGVASGTTYYYKVTAVNAAGEGPASSELSASSTSAASSLNFANGFATGTAGLLAFNGGATVSGSRLRLTDSTRYQARSVFSVAPQSISAFSTSFQFQTQPGTNLADGFTFTIQGMGASAVGSTGGYLGYGTDGRTSKVESSLAIKFDLFNNTGEGANSTGVYTNGQSPLTRSDSLAGTGIDFHSGHTFNASITYDGANLNLTITDTVTGKAFSKTYTGYNIPQLVGGSKAYVGFTAATGGYTATQEILNWTFTPSAASAALAVSAGAALVGTEGTPVSFQGAAAGSGTLTYAWNFGDGSSTTGTLSPQHTYSDNGTYTATLRVTDTTGRSSTSTTKVTVNNAAPWLDVPGTVSGSASSPLPFTVKVTDPSSADQAAGFTYKWDFGDGSTSSAASPIHAYAKSGVFPVTLLVTDRNGGTSKIVSEAVVVPSVSAGTSLKQNEGSPLTFAGSAVSAQGSTYAWNFGDGTTATGSLMPTHTYTDNGNYTATLTVTDPSGLSSRSSVAVTILNVAPTAAFSGPTTATSGTALSFSDPATDPSSVDTSAGFTYRWNFGDGTTAQGETVSHTYSAPGTYTLTVTATDKDGATSAPVTKTIVVSGGLSLKLSGAQTANEGQSLALAGTLTGGVAPFTYTWSFGDGTTATGSLATSHTYQDNGSYTAKLTVRDAANQIATGQLALTIANVAPTVSVSRTTATATVNTALSLSATAVDPSSSDTQAGFAYRWLFGDGTSGTGANPTHTYTAPGVYTATVTATDKNGGTSPSASMTITVAASSAPAVPDLATWESHMLTYGKTYATWLIQHQDDAAIDPPLAATYYDASRVFYNLADYTGDPFWNTAAKAAIHVYRDRFVMANNGGTSGYWNFGQGLAEDYRRTGDVASRDALFLMAQNAAYSQDWQTTATLSTVDLSREVAYALMTRLEAESLGMPHSEYTDRLATIALGHIATWVSGTATYVRPFMVALTCEALIKYQQYTGDSRVLPAVKSATAWIWANCWNEAGKAFQYTNIDTSKLATTASGYNTGGTELAPDLNLLIAPVYAWLYSQTGDTSYRDQADKVFAGGVEGAWLGNAKQFNQNYRWSFEYLAWRGE